MGQEVFDISSSFCFTLLSDFYCNLTHDYLNLQCSFKHIFWMPDVPDPAFTGKICKMPENVLHTWTARPSQETDPSTGSNTASMR